jgi:Tol biopolymer transport system component
VAFVSNRSGAAEVWVADKDGGRAERLTSIGANPGYPRWSPDGKTLAFHGALAERVEVVSVPATGGATQILTASQPNGGYPSFSRDGRWLYFCVIQEQGTDRRCRIWKMPVAGGSAVQVTTDPGTLAIESYDRRHLYYIEASERAGSPLWRLPIDGGPRTKVLDGVLSGQFDVTERGIYFVDQASPDAGAFYIDSPGETRLRYLDFETKQISMVATNLGWVGLGLSASRDGRTVLFTRIDSSINELTIVDRFR